MADEEEREKNAIEEDELELCLGLRPLHSNSRAPSNKNLLETPPPICLLSKRDAQALRRFEAKKKRDLKRTRPSSTTNNPINGVVSDDENNNNNKRREREAADNQNASFLAPAWWVWHGGFRPYQGQNGKIAGGLNDNNEGNKDGENRQSVSSGSSSGISDNYQTTSGPGGNSSDAGSQSSHPHPQQKLPPPNLSTPNPTSQTQPCSSQVQLQQPNTTHPQPSNQIEATSSDKVPTNSTAPPRSPIRKEPKGQTGPIKPPKPNGPTNEQKIHQLSQMPCVSTTGNGPNGKTITGFLYRYSKAAEVSIVCVCHGSSFSPAGFVEHAGGVDVENPLRHIRVVPFALG